MPERNAEASMVSRAGVIASAVLLSVAASACGGGGTPPAAVRASAPGTARAATPVPPSATPTPVAKGIAAVLLNAGAPVVKIAMAGDNLDPNGGRFLPSTATVKVGQVVEWDFNPSGVPGHNIVFDDSPDLSNTRGLGQKPNGDPGDGTWQVKFTTPGAYHYICTFHMPTMQGTITVTG